MKDPPSVVEILNFQVIRTRAALTEEKAVILTNTALTAGNTMTGAMEQSLRLAFPADMPRGQHERTKSTHRFESDGKFRADSLRVDAGRRG